ncbi:MAG: TetR/AcrR family transcriptional regulator [Caldilineales bacterium]
MTAADTTVNESRERLLDTAQHLFHQRGFKAVTMQQIARELGVKQASLYYHVPDGKEQLFVEVTTRSFEQHRQGLQAAIDSVGPGFAEQLAAAARWFASQPPISLMGMVYADMPALSDRNTQRLEGVAYRCLFEPIATMFREASMRGEICPMHPDLLAGSFLALMDGITYASSNQQASPPRAAMGEAIVSLLLDGLRPRAENNGAMTYALSEN